MIGPPQPGYPSKSSRCSPKCPEGRRSRKLGDVFARKGRYASVGFLGSKKGGVCRTGRERRPASWRGWITPKGRDRVAEGMVRRTTGADDGRIRNDKGGDLERVGTFRALGGTLAGHSGRTAGARSGRDRTPRDLAGGGAHAGPDVGR